jgi:two-component system cell cycle sensor histidine kinase/response regulator CckA
METRPTTDDWSGSGRRPPDLLPHIFEPFFTTKGPGEGSGLGLAQVHGIVGQHGGRIDVQTQVGQVTTFTIYLPALEVRLAEPALPDVAAEARGRGQVVLVVEDGDAVRAALVTTLEQWNYRVLEATNGEGALAMMEKRTDVDRVSGARAPAEAGRPNRALGGQVALVLSDVVMPGMGGIALFHALREQGWQMPVILLTGHPMDEELDALRARGLTAWLPKPPSVERLAQAVADALQK